MDCGLLYPSLILPIFRHQMTRNAHWTAHMIKHDHPGLITYAKQIHHCISDFDIDISGYKCISFDSASSPGDASNRIYVRDKLPAGIQIIFDVKAKDSCVVIDNDFTGRGSKITVSNKNCVVYIGKDVALVNVKMKLLGPNDFILVGGGVSVTSTNAWITSLNSGLDSNGIIIGDHCLMAEGVLIRSADGHPLIDLSTNTQINKSQRPVVIDPYCWIGQRSTILKNVHIGACSIVALGAVVTKPCSSFSMLSGVPAKATSLSGKLWLRNNSKKAKEIFERYKKRFARD